MIKNTLEDLIKKALKESKLTEKEINPIKAKDGEGNDWEYCPCPNDENPPGITNYTNCGPNCECCTEGGGKIVNPKGKGKKILKKEAEVTAGESNTVFNLKVDVSNKQSETKLGIRIQLEPKEGMLEQDVRDKLEATIMKKLNTSLGQYDIQVSTDTDVPDPSVIGFFIPLSQIKNMVVKSIKGPGDTATPPNPQTTPPAGGRETPSSPTPPASSKFSEPLGETIDNIINEEIITEMRVRELKEISKVISKEDFYSFINAGNNVLRTLEENGIQNGKKYLEYLTKHNIM